MVKVQESVIKESYLLKSTFFYNRLHSEGYFGLFKQINRFARIEGARLNWDSKSEWSISEEAWRIISEAKIAPMLIFCTQKFCNLAHLF